MRIRDGCVVFPRTCHDAGSQLIAEPITLRDGQEAPGRRQFAVGGERLFQIFDALRSYRVNLAVATSNRPLTKKGPAIASAERFVSPAGLKDGN